ncbi:hypothetical protein [Arthrobacter sp. PAMC25284]|uniref:hypothetical protein n=1 Tax=Arthrobacter sp. PAMC25284 TaxID=2861279 RepID=UPI001C629C25|nr:hypothetical protein [Arthrobacter sp. PAMC25284]QYF89704.1 hypothetical protein KY499_17035 [Arthrobacter sp. PAMC25284]
MNAAPCPQCMEFYLRGHLEGQGTAQQLAENAARIQLALELEAGDNRKRAKAAGSWIDVEKSRSTPGTAYVPRKAAA